jgi:predicted ATPase
MPAPRRSTGHREDHLIGPEEASEHRGRSGARHAMGGRIELRAATSLSRLLQQQGKHEDARRTLAEIHSWFTEGFDTADIRDATALLEELSPAST